MSIACTVAAPWQAESFGSLQTSEAEGDGRLAKEMARKCRERRFMSLNVFLDMILVAVLSLGVLFHLMTTLVCR